MGSAAVEGGACRREHEQALTPEELGRSRRFVYEEDASRFVARRFMLRAVLAGYLTLPPSEVPITTTRTGKPRLQSGAPCDLRFNLSSSADLIVLAIAFGRDVGVDVERIDPGPSLRELSFRFFTPAEAQQLCQEDDLQQQSTAFFRCWTAKEAVLKASGEGLSVPLRDLEFDPATGAVVRRRGLEGGEEQWWVTWPFLATDYVAALAVRDLPRPRLALFPFDLIS